MLDLVDRLLEARGKEEPLPPPLPVAELLEVSVEPERTHPYGRKILGADARGEVLLVQWRPGQRCAPHDHGTSGGLVFLLRGALRERHYTFSDRRLRRLGERDHPGKRPLAIAPGAIHDMVAGGEAVSLHVYWPRIERMRVYDVAERRTLVVGGDCGAWIPDRPQDLLEAIPW